MRSVSCALPLIGRAEKFKRWGRNAVMALYERKLQACCNACGRGDAYLMLKLGVSLLVN
jgi:hypothetical protein